MPDLRPFYGLRYDSTRFADAGAMLCPPYDVISPSEREELLARSAQNAVRLELPAPSPSSATDADYERAAWTLHEWIGDGTLRRDARPMVYVYEQRYARLDGTPSVARSFFCRLRLEEYGPASGVRPHERTLAGPREHRFRLLGAVRTHLSPVLFLYDDGNSGADAATFLEGLSAPPPDVDAVGPGGVGQRLWAVDPAESAAAHKLLEAASRGPLYIADGHHRYETALRYRDTSGSPDDAHFVLSLLFEARSGGLELAPWHRVIAGVADAATSLARTRALFETTDISDAARLAELVEAETQAGVMAAWTRAGGLLMNVDVTRAAILDSVGSSEAVRRLDVSVLSGTLGRMIGASEHELTVDGRLSYTHNAREAIAIVDRGEADICFLLRPTPVEQVLAVAGASDFMPPKSTYFYPKAATGLVFDPLFE